MIAKGEDQLLAPPRRSTAGQVGNLSTIIEESGSYKSSSSGGSSQSTASSVPDSLANRSAEGRPCLYQGSA